MIIIGLTGGIACGKTTVSEVLKKHGYVIIDLDLIARLVVQPDRWAFKKIVEDFGEEVVGADGNLDRKKLGSIIFNDTAARKRLERYTHYPIFLEMFKMLFWNYWKGTPYIILDVPLLFETGINKITHNVIVVTTTPEIQLERLMKREKISKEEAMARINAQMSLEEKERRADIIVENSGGLENLEKLVLDAVEQSKKKKSWLPRNSLIVYAFTASVALAVYFLM